MTTFDRPRGGLLAVLRGLGSTALLVALVLGSPVALVMWGRAGELRRLGPAALSSPDDGSLFLGLATAVGWLAWLVFTVCLVAEAVDLASESRLQVRIPGLGGVQGLAAGMLVASLALLAPVGGTTSPTQATTITGTAPGGCDAGIAPADDDHGAAVVGNDAVAGRDGPRGIGNAAVGPVPDVPAARIANAEPRTDAGTDRRVERATGAQHLVGLTDSLWSVAESWYGDGTAWRRIVAANPGLDPTDLPVGQVIAIPGVGPHAETHLVPDALPATGDAGEEVQREEEVEDGERTVVVRSGDTLSGLARTHLGDAERWPEIWELNRDLIADPDLIDIGWSLTLPVAGSDGTERQVETEEVADADRAGTPLAGRIQTPGPGAAPSVVPPAEASSTAPAPRSPAPPPPLAQSTAQSVQPSVTSPAPSPGVPSEAELPPTGWEGGGQWTVPSPVRTALAGLSLFLAGGVSGALVVGRRRQLFSRPLGRRVPVFDEMGSRLRAMLAAATDLRSDPRPSLEADDAVTAHGSPMDSTPADGVPTGPAARRTAPAGAVPTSGVSTDSSATPPLVPSTVVLGTRPVVEVDGVARDENISPVEEPVLLDLGSTSGWFGVTGPEADAAAMVAGIALSLTCTWWSEGLEVTACGDSLEWLAQTGREEVTLAGHDQVAADLADLVHAPRALVEEWPPVDRVVLLDSAPRGIPDPRLLRRAGVVVVSPVPGSADHQALLDGSDLVRIHNDGSATLGSLSFVPQLVGEPVRRGVVDLMATASRTETEPADWWDGESPPAPRRRAISESTTNATREVTVVHSTGGALRLDPGGVREPTNPMLRLLGPVELVGARGPEPSRGIRQCLEYCGWILDHPGSGSTRMRESLLVAEPTRRSNMSRLRRWLGRDDDGHLYLPEAYDGVIRLDDTVGSDWERLQLLIAGGIATAEDRSLASALELVRGAPLADAAPGQWHWAEEWRVEMMQTVRDIGVELARRAMTAGDLDTARRALARALVCCPEDEELLTSRIRLAHLAGERSEVERLVYLLARRARRLGVDLSEETVVLLQEVMEGRPRARVV